MEADVRAPLLCISPVSYRGSDVLVGHILRHSRHSRKIRPVVCDLVSGKRTIIFFVSV
jgi:hypothetical protein